MNEEKGRRSDSSKTDWGKEAFIKKNAPYEEKIRHLEREIESLRSHIRLAEEMLERHFRDKKKRPYEIDWILRLMRTDDGVSPWNWQDRDAVTSMVSDNLIENVSELYNYLQGKQRPSGFGEGLLMPQLSEDMAWEIIYVLQEGLRIIPDHIERCDNCGTLYNTDSGGRYSELEGKCYCECCLDRSEVTFCGICGTDVWKDKSYDEDSGDYLCEECKRKCSGGEDSEAE
ncbi:MAG: hypothetical protein LBQ88_07305 [Treponema sp.]|jgi:hypothetical protein|nr:hypothetical protein [Treponema sp.]